MEIIKDFFTNFCSMFISMSFYIMLGLFFVGILNVYINKQKILEHFGANNLSSVIKASAAGVPLPLCSCGVVPTAVELKKSGASNGAVISFLISTPQTGVDSILATYSMLGTVMAVFRALAAFFSGIIGGFFVNIFAKNDTINANIETSSCCCSSEPVVETSCCCSSEPVVETSCCCSSEPVVKTSCCCSSEPVVETSCCCSSEPVVETSCCCSSEPVVETSCCSSNTAPKNTPKFVRAMKYAYGSFLNDISGHFMVGMIIATFISTFLPSDFFISLGLNEGLLAMVGMVLIGLPMYICSTSSIPIALALVAKGLSAGSAFVFLFTGPVTNIASILVLNKALGKKITTMYTFIVVFCSIGFGLLLDFLVNTFDLSIMNSVHIHNHSSHTNAFSIIVSIIFAILIIRSFYEKFNKKA